MISILPRCKFPLMRTLVPSCSNNCCSMSAMSALRMRASNCASVDGEEGGRRVMSVAEPPGEGEDAAVCARAPA